MVWKNSSGINESNWSWSLCDFSVVQKLQGGSLCQEFCFLLPRRLLCSIFLLQQVPRLYQCYLFIAFSSLPNRRHHWHWLRCVKNLLMCLNYLCLMLGASVCSSALGQHYSGDGNSFKDRSFASYFVALLRETPRGTKAITNTLINS